MRLAPDWKAWPVPGQTRLATANRAGFWAGGNRAAILITSSAPGRSKSTISVEQRPVVTSSSARWRELQRTYSISSSSREAFRTSMEGLSLHRTAAEWRMNYKVRVDEKLVNVTPVIAAMVTEALCKSREILCLCAGQRVPGDALLLLKIALMTTKRLIRSTTVLSVRRNGSVVLAGDGQVTLGESVIKHSAKKIRRLYNDKIVAGFAGSTADAFTLFSRFEAKLEQYHGNLGRGAVELARDWRTDKFLRHLEALLLVSDKEQTFLLSGQGDVIEPDGPVAAIGSGGPYALAAAQALSEHTQLSARQIAEEAMKIAGKMCIYTNDRVTIEEL